MSDSKTIDHLGFIETVTGNKATVRINSQSACAACHAKGACTAADQEDKILSVSTGGNSYKVGEQVKVLIAQRTGLKAVAFGYVYPFLLLMAILIILSVAGVSELKAGLWSLASLPPYYLGIYLLREKIDSSFSFTLVKLFNDL